MGFGSTIKPKTGTCIDCKDGILKRLTAGRCSFHYQVHRAKVCAERKKSRITPTDALEKTFGMGKPQSELYLFYAACMKECTGYCQECGEFIPYKYRHASIAHLLKKSLFPSVATNINNWLELGAGCGCHHRQDSSYDAMQKMKVFPEIKRRFKLFEHLIAPEERRRIPECLLKD